MQQIPNGVDVKEPKIPQGTLALASETGHRTGGFLRLPVSVGLTETPVTESETACGDWEPPEISATRRQYNTPPNSVRVSGDRDWNVKRGLLLNSERVEVLRTREGNYLSHKPPITGSPSAVKLIRPQDRSCLRSLATDAPKLC